MRTFFILFLSCFLFACQSTQKANLTDTTQSVSGATSASPKSTAASTQSKENITEWNCEEPSFSYTGEQLIFWCSIPGLIKQQQIFIKDFNSNEVKQVSFLSGRINSPQIVKPDLVVFASDTDRRKDTLSLEQKIFDSESLFEIYMYNLRDDEMMILSHNQLYDGSIEYLKHIDPKIVFLQKKQNETLVISKNLTNLSEKVLYKTSNPIQELRTNHSNVVLVVENNSGKKLLTLIKNDKEKIILPELGNNKFNFLYLPDTQRLEYLEEKNNKTVIKNFDLTTRCENEIYTFSSAKISQLRKSPLDNQTYVWVEEAKGLKNIKMGTLATNPSSPCNKLSKRKQRNLRL